MKVIHQNSHTRVVQHGRKYSVQTLRGSPPGARLEKLSSLPPLPWSGLPRSDAMENARLLNQWIVSQNKALKGTLGVIGKIDA